MEVSSPRRAAWREHTLLVRQSWAQGQRDLEVPSPASACGVSGEHRGDGPRWAGSATQLCHVSWHRALEAWFQAGFPHAAAEPVSSFASIPIGSISRRRPVPLAVGNLLDSWTGYQPDYTTCLHVIRTARASRPCPRPVCFTPSCFPHVV